MKVINNVIAIALSALAMTSCMVNTRELSGRIISESTNRVTLSEETPAFNTIKIKGAVDVTYVVSDKSEYKAEIPEDLKDYFEIKVNENGVLEIGLDTKKFIVWKGSSATITAYGPQLYGVGLSGSGDFYAEKISLVGEFSAKINGSGDIEIGDLVSDKAGFEINGSGDIEVKKINTYDLNAEIHGSGDIDIAGKTEGGRLAIYGAGDINVSKLEVAENLETVIKGSGDIHR